MTYYNIFQKYVKININCGTFMLMHQNLEIFQVFILKYYYLLLSLFFRTQYKIGLYFYEVPYFHIFLLEFKFLKM